MPLLDDLAAIARRLVPEACPRCAGAGSGGFCSSCRDEFARIASPCPDCGLPEPCRPCPAAAPGWQLDALIAPFVYRAPLANCLQTLKFRRQRWLGASLGELLAAEIDAADLAFDAIVPVPLHPRRLRARSFNQADEIARPVARKLDLPLLAAGIRRRRDTRPQTTLDRADRLSGLERAFEVRRNLAGRRIAVVDDVITTAATVNALAAALMEAGAASVIACAVARTTSDKDDAAQSTRNR